MKHTPIFGMVNFIDDAHFRRVWKHPKKTINSRQKAWVHYMPVWVRLTPVMIPGWSNQRYRSPDDS